MNKARIVAISGFVLILVASWAYIVNEEDDLSSPNSSMITSPTPDSNGLDGDRELNAAEKGNNTAGTLSGNLSNRSETVVVDSHDLIFRDVLRDLSYVQYAYFSEMVRLSDSIIVGEVVSMTQTAHVTSIDGGEDHSEQIDIDEVGACENDQDAAHQIEVELIIKGKELSSLKLRRPDRRHTPSLYLPNLQVGQRILLFSSELQADETDSAQFWTFGNNAIVDIDENSNAIPRNPHLFSYGYHFSPLFNSDCFANYNRIDDQLNLPEVPIRPIANETKEKSNIGLSIDAVLMQPHIELDKLINIIKEQLDEVSGNTQISNTRG